MMRKEKQMIPPNINIQLDLFGDDDELEGKLFELYQKTSNREFKSHVQFLKADTLRAAEDKISETIPDYWKTMSVRSVDLDYAWETFTHLHYSYNMAKTILGLGDLEDD